MESSVPNNTTLMATGASIADIPLEEDFGVSSREKNESPIMIREETPAELLSEVKGEGVSTEESASEVKVSEVQEEVDKILQEVKTSG